MGEKEEKGKKGRKEGKYPYFVSQFNTSAKKNREEYFFKSSGERFFGWSLAIIYTPE